MQNWDVIDKSDKAFALHIILCTSQTKHRFPLFFQFWNLLGNSTKTSRRNVEEIVEQLCLPYREFCDEQALRNTCIRQYLAAKYI